ncbi:glycosyltransferase [Nocardioides seonyuensis]|uniref:Glycosyltransferase n=1 Tax=Nocardioides seonyuensis TaxID=2518371 RepID=A0A4P7IKT2_9ACTN|nr:glycosyltransferase [Nocardioides seonyuensis]
MSVCRRRGTAPSQGVVLVVNHLIGIPTYRRPEALARLLAVLGDQVPPDVPVVVADNDPGLSARAVVLAAGDLEMHYLAEPSPGVALVRTRLMAEALRLRRNLWFLDDDQVPSSNWYQSMLDGHARHPEAILAGPVNYVLPVDAPSWARTGHFVRPEHEDGAQLEATGFGNCVLPLSALSVPGLSSVDAAFARSGGEDTEYMWRARREGVEIRWCAGATVEEVVPAARVTRAALRGKYVRNGETLARLRLREKGRLVILAGGLLRVSAGLLHLAIATATRRGTYRALTMTCGGWGWVRAALGRVSRAYGD